MARDQSRRVVTLDQIVQHGCDLFLSDGGVDMDALACRVAVSRATLYRVVGSRDRLLTEVVWLLTAKLLQRCCRTAGGNGVEWVIGVTRHFASALRASESFETFLRRDPELAARTLFGADAVHPRTVAAQRRILVEAGLGPQDRLEEAAYLYVRIIESSLFADLLVGAPIEDSVAERAARAVLAQMLDGP
ncbi:QsdR family transcriptional regulator [Aeromicrobium sp. CTD01-1L150]|uniref:QsdR family transcriptional regulator n=1 Tax=Aeromicrobium sp. CTD01-1L150 TaxID=3341830 RepID=UPI0035C181E9